ncbi:MAG: trypsin-like peptidase domain-containing protein, partial [Paracoccaceae bacterium]
MRGLIFCVAVITMVGVAGIATAQQTVWVQIEAQKSLARAQQVARAYSADLQNVSGFAMRTGWYAIAIGPFSPFDAEDVLQQLRVTRQIPVDSYLVDGSEFRRQFWPVGAQAALAQPAIRVPEIATDAVAALPLIPGEQTVTEARRAESQLNRQERMLLQSALQWEGFYTSAIDGAIGPGTRNSMSLWQTQEGFEATGVLTTLQRQILINRYQEMLATLGMSPLIDGTTGIQIDLPTALVTFERYEPPFAHYKSIGASGVQVLLISQSGDKATLRSLYDVMQTLEIVPLDGARRFGRREFTLTGKNSKISSYSYAALANGQVKGFTLIWSAQPDRRRDLVINAMKSSFSPFDDAVLPDEFGGQNSTQSLDLMAGLNIRQPDVAGSGFYVDANGAILTSSANVRSCGKITIDDEFDVELAAIDANYGLALLRPPKSLSPIAVAQFLANSPRLNSEIAVAGYSYGGALGAPSLTFGTLADLRGLNGDTAFNRLAV